MEGTFTRLERTILEIIAEAEPGIGPRLREILATANVTKRDNTGHGFFTYMETDTTFPRLKWKDRIISGPNVRVGVGGKSVPMGTILFLRDGHPHFLEGFQYAGDVDLHDFDLADIKFLGLMDDDAI